MKRFEKIAKRYALANSYFKNRLLIWPDTLCEIHDYLQQHGELPFRYDGDNWSYDALCERQKRRGVRLSQYLTPDATARQIAALAVRYFENDSRIMDVCCGTGQLTRALIAAGVHPSQIVVIGNEKYIIFGKMEYIRISNNDASFSVTMIQHYKGIDLFNRSNSLFAGL